jgi:hypothetical protein
MKRDQYGRAFLTGDENGPNDLTCMKCDNVAYTQGNPFGVHVFEFTRGDMPGHASAFALCGPCAISLWEFLSPELAATPGYLARKDQHDASVSAARMKWNERACEHEQLEP